MCCYLNYNGTAVLYNESLLQNSIIYNEIGEDKDEKEGNLKPTHTYQVDRKSVNNLPSGLTSPPDINA